MTWKQVVVIPVIKWGDHSGASIYRPISISKPIISYCLNRIAIEQLTS